MVSECSEPRYDTSTQLAEVRNRAGRVSRRQSAGPRRRSIRPARPYPGEVTEPVTTPRRPRSRAPARRRDRPDRDATASRLATSKCSTKPDRSHVTDADLAVERAIRGILETERPDDGVFGEEYGAHGRRHGSTVDHRPDRRDGELPPRRLELGDAHLPRHRRRAGRRRRQRTRLHARWWGAIGTARGASGRRDQPRAGCPSRGSPTSPTRPSASRASRSGPRSGGSRQLLALCGSLWRDRAIGDMWPYMLLAEGSIDAVAEFGVQEYDLRRPRADRPRGRRSLHGHRRHRRPSPRGAPSRRTGACTTPSSPSCHPSADTSARHRASPPSGIRPRRTLGGWYD